MLCACLRAACWLVDRRVQINVLRRWGLRPLSTTGLLTAEDFAAFMVENAQSYRSRRPLDICGGDDCGRDVRYMNLDFPQSCRSVIRGRADILDSERARRGGGDGRQFGFRPQFGKGSRLARRGLFSIGNENGIHCQPYKGVNVLAATDLACNRQCNKTPVLRDFIGTGFVFTAPRLAVCGLAKIVDQRLGLSVYAINPRVAVGQPRQHWRLPWDQAYRLN